jgi:hypothetical protein
MVVSIPEFFFNKIDLKLCIRRNIDQKSNGTGNHIVRVWKVKALQKSHGPVRDKMENPVQMLSSMVCSISVSENTTNRAEIKKEHQEQLEKVGKVPSLKVEMSLLHTYVNQTLWKKKKFIAAGSELDFNSRLCIKVLTDLSVGGNTDNKRTFWCRNRKHNCGILGIKRNNVVTSIKQNFFSK